MTTKLTFAANSVQFGTGNSKVTLASDSGNLTITDYQSNTTTINPGAGVVNQTSAGRATVFANTSSLPLSANAGDFAYTTANNFLYISNGSGWFRIAIINQTPTLSLSNNSITLGDSANTFDITYTTADPEGLTPTVSLSNSGIANTDVANVQLYTANTTITFNNISGADGDNFTVIVSSTDGVNITTANLAIAISIVSVIGNSAETVLLAKASGNGGDNSSFTDNSSSSHTITNVSDAVASSFSPYRSGGYSVYFDGTGDNVETTSMEDLSSGPYTIEGWYYFTSDPNSTNTILWAYTTGTANGYAQLHTPTGTTLRLQKRGGTLLSDGTFDFSINTWYHIATVWDGTNMRVYVDGTQVINSTTNVIDNSGNGFAIGGSDNFMQGYISDFRIVNGTAVYTSEFTPPSERLTAITNTSLLACHLPYFADGSTNAYTITVNGDTKVEPFTPYDYNSYSASDHGGSALFDGSGDYLSIASDSSFALGTGDFTVEGWFYQNSDTTYPSALEIGNHLNSTGILFIVKNSGQAKIYSGGFYGGATTSLNQWNHIAWVRSSGSLKIFVNGLLGSTTAFTNNLTDTATIKIANALSASYIYPGYISNFRLVKGTAVYTAAFTPPTAPLSAISGTSLLALQGDASIFDASQIHEFTINGDAISSTTQTKNASSSMYFDGSGDSLSFNVSGTELQTIGQSGDPCTIEAWVYVVSAPTNYHTAVYSLGTQGSTGGSNVIGLEIAANLTLRGAVNGAYSATTNMPQTTTALSLNTWHHIAMVSDGTTWTIFIDGTSEATASGSYPSGTAHSTAYIGRVFYEATRTTEMYIEDLRITKGLSRYPFIPPEETLTAITNTVLLACHTNSLTTDGSGNHTLTSYGNVAVSDYAPFTGGKSIYFDGTGDYISIPTSTDWDINTTNYTFEAWVNIADGDTSYNAIFSTHEPNSPYYGWEVDVTNSGQLGYWTKGTGGQIDYLTNGFGPTINDGKWHHVAATWSSSTIKLFVDGTLVHTNSSAPLDNTAQDTTVYIGRDGNSTAGRPFGGYISNLRIVKGSLVYTNSFTPPTSELTG